MIVLNGQPFIRYNLRSLYPFAHEIIVVEGACVGSRSNAARDGHSADGTLDSIREFQRHEDSDQKITLVTAEQEGHPDGFWPGEKEEQSRAYASRATGDYLWQVDVDEFYHPDHIRLILRRLHEDPSISQISFKEVVFWGTTEYRMDGAILRTGWPSNSIHRVFKWEQGNRYDAHRPVKVVDKNGTDLRQMHWVTSKDSRRWGVFMYHYSLVYPSQVAAKCRYYSEAEWCKERFHIDWASDVYDSLRFPFRVDPEPGGFSWLERFTGVHPPAIVQMIEDLREGRMSVVQRRTDDIRRIERGVCYRLFRRYLKTALLLDAFSIKLRSLLHRLAYRIEARWFARRADGIS